jgi:hypothetical protein
LFQDAQLIGIHPFLDNSASSESINCDAVGCNFSIGWRYPLHYTLVGADRAPAHHDLLVRAYHVVDGDADVRLS